MPILKSIGIAKILISQRHASAQALTEPDFPNYDAGSVGHSDYPFVPAKNEDTQQAMAS